MRLALHAEAEAELDAAATWYDERSEGLGDELMVVARESMMLIPRFPYALAYQAFPGLIAVLAIVHERKKPLYWLRRAK